MAQAQASTSALSSASFSDFNSKVQAAALSATQSAAGLPADISFHRSIDPELAEDLDDFSAHVLSLTNNLLALVSTGDSSKSNRRKGKAKLQNQDDVVDDFHSLIVDSVDQLLERTVRVFSHFQCIFHINCHRTYASTSFSEELRHRSSQ
jgi:exosome complex exonuclease RRP6